MGSHKVGFHSNVSYVCPQARLSVLFLTTKSWSSGTVGLERYLASGSKHTKFRLTRLCDHAIWVWNSHFEQPGLSGPGRQTTMELVGWVSVFQIFLAYKKILPPFLKITYSREKFCFKKIYLLYFQSIFY